ncbi:hypothetical protein V8G54_029577 [Vigna mungo]|uniref:ferroxidase n=1 Tax=Vigna mungo TaxID=3915 RepID=A0AAQ3MUJ9_VIGMU
MLKKLMKYQNSRGGRVVLHPIMDVPLEFEHVEKRDKLVNEKLRSVHNVADRNNDPQLAYFIESEFLSEQVEEIKNILEYVAQLRRVGKGHGVWHFDLCNYTYVFCAQALNNPKIRTVTEIDLNHNDIAGYVLEDLNLLTDLAFLHINTNRFCGTMPHKFDKLKLLFELNLSNN